MKTTLKITVEATTEKGSETLYKTELNVSEISVEQLVNVSRGFSKTFQAFVNQELPRLLCRE